MYLSVFLILCVSTLTWRLAQADGRSGMVWGLIGLLIAILCFRFIAQPVLAGLVSIVISVIVMTLANIWFPAPKSAGLKRAKH